MIALIFPPVARNGPGLQALDVFFDIEKMSLGH